MAATLIGHGVAVMLVKLSATVSIIAHGQCNASELYSHNTFSMIKIVEN